MLIYPAVLEYKNIFIFGYSGHAYVVLDAVLSNNFVVKGYFDKYKAEVNPYDLLYKGFEQEVDVKPIVDSHFVFPSIGSNEIRTKVINLFEKLKLNETKIIDASAKVSVKTTLDNSTFIGPNAVVNSMTVIGKGVIVNSGAIVEHECKIGNFSHIAPGAVLAGNVNVGNNTFVGANAIIKEGITLGENVTIGAGSVVLQNVADNETWVGNPAKRIR